ncbi:MAG: TIP-1 family-domain-containing protein [Linnemannia gamsii]|nr:MAG: TIP-1 family-domain-containing protein [Linnemannia gamsii]
MASLAIHPPAASSAFKDQNDETVSRKHSSSNVIVFDQTIDVDEDVTDFFNARFNSREDLANIKNVLREQTAIGDELNKKLEESKKKTAQALKMAQNMSKASLDSLQNLESSALDLEEQMEHSEAFASGKNKRDQRSLIEELSDLQSRVQALEDAKRYILIISRTQKLISETRELLETSASKALVPYTSLAEISRSVKETLGGKNTKLEAFLTASVNSLLQELKASLAKKFQASLDAIGWPKPITDGSKLTVEQQDTFEAAFKDLLLLQEPAYGPLDRSDNKPYPPLLTTEQMVAPLILRFRFHFEGKRPTNRLDKPEWYLTHILELIKDHSSFLQTFVQGIVQDTEYKEYDAKNDFTRLLLEAVERKICNTVPEMLSSPELLSHAIHETLRFDKTLRETELYIPPGQTSEWQGAVQVYLGNRPWLKTWLRVEKEFAVARYEQIMEDADAWQPAYDNLDEKDYIIPTKSAENLMDLLEIVTERYRPLTVLEHRTFLLDIQLDILIAYHRHIRGLVDQYESITYSFVRVMPGAVSTDELATMGVEGLRNLCQWLSSVEYVSSTLKDWAEDIFFLELYKEISERTQKVVNPMHSENEESDHEDEPNKKLDENGTIFDESIRGFTALSKRIQDLIIRNITKEVFSSMKPYVSLASWPQIEFSTMDSRQPYSPTQTSQDQQFLSLQENDDISPELYQPLNILTHSFEFLSAALPTKLFITFYRQIALEMQDYIWQRVMMKNSFSELGGMQFTRDIQIGLWGAGRRWIKKTENYHRKLRDACILLSLQSAKANSPPPQPQLTFDQDVRRGVQASDKGPVYAKRTLAQIMAVLFDEDLAQDVIKAKLEEIGVMHLGLSEARDVVRRRVECWR